MAAVGQRNIRITRTVSQMTSKRKKSQVTNGKKKSSGGAGG